MVKLKEIKDFLESLIPLQEQDSWDNSGLQFGDENAYVKKVGFALSVSSSITAQAKEENVDLIISHHPLTISGLKTFSPKLYPQNLLIELVKEGIFLYSLHTNLDVSPFGPTAIIAENLGLKKQTPINQNPPYGILGELPTPMTQKELLSKLASFLPEDAFRTVFYRPEAEVKRVAVCSGSGALFIDRLAAKADVFVTGDVKYHDALKALELSLTVFDMGHFGTERLFYEKIKPLLEENFPEVEFVVLKEYSPFEVVNRD